MDQEPESIQPAVCTLDPGDRVGGVGSGRFVAVRAAGSLTGVLPLPPTLGPTDRLDRPMTDTPSAAAPVRPDPSAIEPAPTPRYEPSATPPRVSGKLLEKREGLMVLGLPGSEYRLQLVLEIDLPAEVGQKVSGTIHATARRVDVIPAGGRYVEPIYGRPRRVQGRIVGGHGPSRTLYVKAGPTLICTLSDPRQQVPHFEIGQMVSFDVEPNAVFKPVLT